MWRKTLLSILVSAVLGTAQASWYWPFGDDNEEAETNDVTTAGGIFKRRGPRLSDKMGPASELIDEASDLAADGKSEDAIAKYREALALLAKIEAENPDFKTRPEFATLRTKKAYVNAAIDSLILTQARDNAKTVAVSDTTELEKKLEKELKGEVEVEDEVEEKVKRVKSEKVKVKSEKVKREKINKVEAEKKVRDLTAKPGSAKELNVQAMKKAEAGDFTGAESLLTKAIKLYPRSYYAYYNMAWLIYESNPNNLSGVKRYYETGRTYGGPVDKALEAIIK